MHRWLAPLALLITACGTPTVDSSPTIHTPVAAPAAPAAAVSWSTFGEPISEDNVLAASDFLSDPSAHLNKTVTVEGRVSEVCQQAGCWMVMSHEDQHIRVRMKDHAFGVDKDASGSRCQVQGRVVEKTLDPVEVAHFASETRDGGIVPEHAAAGGRTFEIVANGVRIASGN